MSIVRQCIDQEPSALQNEVDPFFRRHPGKEIEFELDFISTTCCSCWASWAGGGVPKTDTSWKPA
jgi:hypothetical protein